MSKEAGLRLLVAMHAETPDREVVHKCLQEGADINIKSEDGNTPLHIAVRNEWQEIVHLLLSYPQLEINSKNVKEETPIDLARQNGNQTIINCLQLHLSPTHRGSIDNDEMMDQSPFQESTSNMAAHGDNIATGDVSLPRFKTIKYDDKLQLTSSTVEVESILLEAQWETFHTLDDIIDDVPPFPNNYVLSSLSEAVLSNADKQPKLPNGWKLLTAAQSTDCTNGYYGTAYWNDTHQHVVIAHRGTKLTKFNIDALYNDVTGIPSDDILKQVNSAVTFADQMLQIINTINKVKQKNGMFISVSITGHSLGGWLSQITTFTAKYLTNVDNNFVLSNVEGSHVHTVAFDSPGCKQSLEKLKVGFKPIEQQQPERSIRPDINALDISVYLSAPNRVNRFHPHAGTVYRLFISPEKVNQFRNDGLYSHKIENIKECFNITTGQANVLEIVDCTTQTNEDYSKLYSFETHTDSELHYKTKPFDSKLFRTNTFTETELQVLQLLLLYSRIPDYGNFIFPTQDCVTLVKKIKYLSLDKSRMDMRMGTVHCKTLNQAQRVIRAIKRVLHFYPHIATSLDDLPFAIRKETYVSESKLYLTAFDRYSVEFEVPIIRDALHNFPNKVVNLVDKNMFVGALKVLKILKNEQIFDPEKHIFLSLQHLQYMERHLKFSEFLKSARENVLIVIECRPNLHDSEVQFFNESLSASFNYIKFIIISGKEIKEHYVHPIHHSGIKFSDLSNNTQKVIMDQRLIDFQGTSVSLTDIIATPILDSNTIVDKLFGTEELQNLLSGETIQIGKALPNLGGVENYFINRYFTSDFVYLIDPVNCANHKSIFVFHSLDRLHIKSKMHTSAHVHTVAELTKQDTKTRKFTKYVKLQEVNPEEQLGTLCTMFPDRDIFLLESAEPVKILEASQTNCAELETRWHQSKWSERWQYNYNNFNSPDEHWHFLLHVGGFISKQYKLSSSFADGLMFRFKLNKSKCEDADNDTYRPLKSAGTAEKFVNVVGGAGEGKSTLFASLALLEKNNRPHLWVSKVNLQQYSTLFNSISESDLVERDNIVKILKIILGIKTCLENRLFDYYLKVNRIAIYFDAFDEMSPNYENIIRTFIQALQNSAILYKLWLNGRPYIQFDNIIFAQTLILLGFTRDDQMTFLTKFWFDSLNVPKSQLLHYASILLAKIEKSNLGKIAESPLLLAMIAKIHHSQIIEAYNISNGNPEIDLLNSDICSLYNTAIEQQAMLDKQEDFLPWLKQHRLLALIALLKDDLENILSAEEISMANKTISKIKKSKLIFGLIGDLINGVPQFIHISYAEYLAAEWFLDKFVNDHQHFTQLFEIFTSKILNKRSTSALSCFDNFLQSKESLKCSIHNTKTAQTLLMIAAKDGFNNIVEFLVGNFINSGNDANSDFHSAKCFNGHTLLYYAITRQQQTLLNFLIKNISKTNFAAQMIDENLLQLAIKNYNRETILKLCRSIDELIPEEWPTLLQLTDGNTALHTAVIYNSLETLPVLISRGASITRLNNDDRTAPEIAAWHLNAKAIETLLSLAKTHENLDLNDKLNLAERLAKTVQWFNNKSQLVATVLAFIEEACNSAEVKARLDVISGMLTNHGFGYDSPLHNAIRKNLVNKVKDLIEADANTDFVGYIGETPVQLAIRLKHPQCLYVLLQHGAHIDVNETHVLNSAIDSSNEALAELLVAHKVELNALAHSDEFYEDVSPLHVAAKMKRTEMVKLLINSGANVDMKSAHGRDTPLHFASPCNTCLLIESGAHFNEPNAGGVSALKSCLEKCSTLERTKVMCSIVLFSRLGAPGRSLQRASQTYNFFHNNCNTVKYILTYEEFLRDKFPLLFDLIKICKKEELKCLRDLLRYFCKVETEEHVEQQSRLLRGYYNYIIKLDDNEKKYLHRADKMVDFIYQTAERLLKYQSIEKVGTTHYQRLINLRDILDSHLPLSF